MATSGAVLGADDLAKILNDGAVHGLAEMMNFPGVISGDADTLKKLEAFHGRPIDGHAPAHQWQGAQRLHRLRHWQRSRMHHRRRSSGKTARGLYILIREATNSRRNLDPLLPLITPANSRRICFCTDDRQPQDLLSAGGIDYMLRRAIEIGVDPIIAFRCCTLNTTEWSACTTAARSPRDGGRIYSSSMICTNLAASQVYIGGHRIEDSSPASEVSISALRQSCHPGCRISTSPFPHGKERSA